MGQSGHTGEVNTGVRQTGGAVYAGTDIYVMLESGETRAAIVVRAYRPDPTVPHPPTDPELVDCKVFGVPGEPDFLSSVPKMQVGPFTPGTWRFREPQETGLPPVAQPVVDPVIEESVDPPPPVNPHKRH